MLRIFLQMRCDSAETGKYDDALLLHTFAHFAYFADGRRRRGRVTSVMTPIPEGCRSGCGACCIAPSISSAIPGMPDGKPAGVRCVQLSADNRCAIFGDPRRPAVCASLRASVEMCGGDPDVNATRSFAMRILGDLERQTGG